MFKKTILMAVVLLYSGLAFAAHPLITDDTGTQGKGNFQIEFNSEFTTDKETEGGVEIKERGGETALVISYGITDSMDIVLGAPYQWTMVKEDGIITSDEEGISDASLELKWRFYERDGLGLALKPGITLPTGDEDKGLGLGRISYGVTFILTKEIDTLTIHGNLSYAHEEDDTGGNHDMWHASIAGEMAIIKNLKAVANIGIESDSEDTPAFILGGIIYSISDNLDVDLGIKAGLNKPETDITLLAGMAVRF